MRSQDLVSRDCRRIPTYVSTCIVKIPPALDPHLTARLLTRALKIEGTPCVLRLMQEKGVTMYVNAQVKPSKSVDCFKIT